MIEQVITPVAHDLGQFEVRRAALRFFLSRVADAGCRTRCRSATASASTRRRYAPPPPPGLVSLTDAECAVVRPGTPCNEGDVLERRVG